MARQVDRLLNERYPHTCSCGASAYIGALAIECTSRTCEHWDGFEAGDINLDVWGEFLEIRRMPGETDEALRQRIKESFRVPIRSYHQVYNSMVDDQKGI